MENTEFDKLLRDRLSGVSEPAPDVWEGISRGLDRRRRILVFQRFSTAAAAAAAGLAAALLVFRGPAPQQHVMVPLRTAHAILAEPSAQDDQTPSDPVPVAPIAQQIAAFTRNQVTAQAIVPEKESLPEETAPEETAPEEAAPSVSSEPEMTVQDPGATRPQLTENDLPAGYWDEVEAPRKTHTSQISILSNLTAVASEGDLIYKASPMHSSSQSGNRATSQVEPASGSPKFFSPVSLGLQVEVPVADRLSVATGLTYSYLVSQYDMLVDKVAFTDAYNQLHYLGIPVSLSYHFVQTPSLGVYAGAGGAVEKCIAQRYVFGSNTLREKVGGVQWSARVGLGVEYWFVPRLGLYFDPSLVYFFDNKQPLSIRTQQPLQARFEVGLRFKI